MLLKLFGLVALFVVVRGDEWIDAEQDLDIESLRASACEVATPNVTAADKQKFIDEHNRYRAMEDAKGMYAVSWHDELAQRAQAWANTILPHNGLSHGLLTLCNGERIGQNIYMMGHSNLNSLKHMAASVGSWYDEKPDYTFSNRQCRPGKMCGHYTQVVWDSSIKIGCGAALGYYNGMWKQMVVCNYYPAGNWQGKDPYVKGQPGSGCSTTSVKVPAPGMGYQFKNGLCDFCQGGQAGCNCFDCGANGSNSPGSCVCKCKDGYTGNKCEVNCKDRESKNACNSWMQHCSQPSYQQFMQDKCPCTCRNAGHSGYTCCA